MDLNQEFKTTHIELYKLIVKIWTRLEPQIFLQAYMQLCVQGRIDTLSSYN